MTKRNIVILGATGSIGTSAQDVVGKLSGELHLVGVTARHRLSDLATVARRFGCEWAAIPDPTQKDDLAALLPADCASVCQPAELEDRVCASSVDMVLCAVTGTAGLRPVLAAIRAGKDIALASKEILVLAGSFVTKAAEQHNIQVLPVDSEHSAIFQCIQGRNHGDIRRLILTASGGPFRATKAEDIERVTVDQALAHPTWRMGRKVTIDSATLMNKALELIEAHWLFDVPPEKIDVVVHPQSVIHSMVEFVDGTIIAQMGPTDMRIPIQYALTYPDVRQSPVAPFDFYKAPDLTFEPLDDARFPAVNLARRALRSDASMPAVLNAANEVAVEGFCSGRIGFTQIWALVEEVMDAHTPPPHEATLQDILAADRWARYEAAERM